MKAFFNIPKILFALLTIVLMCSFHLKSSAIIALKPLSWVISSSLHLFPMATSIKYYLRGFLFPKCIILHLFTFGFINQIFGIQTRDPGLPVSSGPFKTDISFESSANNFFLQISPRQKLKLNIYSCRLGLALSEYDFTFNLCQGVFEKLIFNVWLWYGSVQYRDKLMDTSVHPKKIFIY